MGALFRLELHAGPAVNPPSVSGEGGEHAVGRVPGACPTGARRRSSGGRGDRRGPDRGVHRPENAGGRGEYLARDPPAMCRRSGAHPTWRPTTIERRNVATVVVWSATSARWENARARRWATIERPEPATRRGPAARRTLEGAARSPPPAPRQESAHAASRRPGAHATWRWARIERREVTTGRGQRYVRS